MTTAHRLRLEILRDTAMEEMRALNPESQEDCRLGGLLVLTIAQIDKLLSEGKGVAIDRASWR